MLNWNEDEITLRNEPLNVENWQIQILPQIERFFHEVNSRNTENTYMLITNKETVDIKSNVILPSWLKAYNSWDNTYITYLSGELSPIPVVTDEQIQILNSAKNNLFISFAAIFGFFLFLNVLSDVFLRWHN